MKRTIAVCLFVWGFNTTAIAGGFGGIELGSSYNSNFNGSPTSAGAVSETGSYLSALLGMYRPISKQAMLVLRSGLRHSRFDKADYLDGNIFNVSAGVYYRFNAQNSLSTMLAARAKRFDDSRRDGEVFSLWMKFKQKQSKQVWLSEQVFYEQGAAEVKSGEYSGYGLTVSLNWKLNQYALVTLGAGSVRRIYEVTLGRERTGHQLNLGGSYSLTKQWYLRGRLGQQFNSDDSGRDYTNTSLSAAVGYRF